ncbi:MAG TPA: P-loop NTPase fold protein [Solirubrobacteraceae bacterium]|nr:P-loop NTPase fold protein [Solirubrobacteraceae bacterium]
MTVETPPATWTRPRFRRLPPIETTRRERWWFSDGAWVDQGQRGSVIGVMLTHWLADRGVEVPDATLDDAYALELYYDSQRRAGQEVGDTGGAQLAAGVQVLQSRDLVQRALRCADIDAVKGALLERGPVAAGLTWYQTMFEPVLVDGIPVCRPFATDASVVGGHAVLLNGIALDLTLDGVTGFVRFKNSWGRGWGRGGQCLISVADLEQLLDAGEFLLLTPVPGSLKPGISPDVAPEDTSPAILEGHVAAPASAPESTAPATPPKRYKPEAIGSDIWTDEDAIGYDVYANAIALGIQHPDTKPPLTIGIKAPWGAGKTSLMRMVRRRLEWPQTWRDPPGKLRRLELKGAGAPSDRPVNYRDLLRELRRRDREPEQLTATPEPEPGDAGTAAQDRDWRPTVWFNPWKYQSGDQIWAGFAYELIEQITGRMSTGQRERFWMRLNVRRLDEQAVRRKVHALVLERIVPWALAVVVVLIGAIVLALAGLTGTTAAKVAAGTPVVLALITTLKGAGVLGNPISGSLAAVLGPAAAVRPSAEGQLSGAFDELVPDPGYKNRAGFFHLVQADVQAIFTLVATRERPLVVFVDDLDRCAPGTVVQVIEAINLFLAGEFEDAIFVVALEPEMVAAHIETAYADLIAKLEASRGPGAQSQVLGWQFLEKFIQLPLSLPEMQDDRMKRYVSTLFDKVPVPDQVPEHPPAGAADGDAGSEATPSADQGQRAAARNAARQMLAAGTLRSTVKLAGAAEPGSAFGEAALDAAGLQLTLEDPGLRTAVTYAVRFLAPNPREIKRFVNVFRFLVMITTARRVAGLAAPDDLTLLAKLAVLSTRWPAVAADLMRPLSLDEERTVFELLENPSSGEDLNRACVDAGLSEASTQRLLSDEFRRFIGEPPMIGPQARDWL